MCWLLGTTDLKKILLLFWQILQYVHNIVDFLQWSVTRISKENTIVRNISTAPLYLIQNSIAFKIKCHVQLYFIHISAPHRLVVWSMILVNQSRQGNSFPLWRYLLYVTGKESKRAPHTERLSVSSFKETGLWHATYSWAQPIPLSKIKNWT